MATLANLVAPSVTPNVPGGKYSATQMSDAVGQELGAMGAGMDHMATALFRVEREEQDRTDRIRVNEQLNALKEEGLRLQYDTGGMYTQKGADAIHRKSGKLLPDEYADQLVTMQKTIRGGLANDRQRQLFDEGAGNMISRFRQEGIQYLGKEKVRYEISVTNGTLKTAFNEFTLAARNGEEGSALAARGRMDAMLWEKKRLEGLSAEEHEAIRSEVYSKSARSVIGSLLDDGKYKQAETWAEANKGMMTADDTFWAKANIDKIAKAGRGQAFAERMFRASRALYEESDIINDITGQAESGNRDYNEDGSVVTSEAGARYRMQVMPETARQPGYGIKPAQSDTPKEWNRVGEQKMDVLVKRYSGDMTKAWAAYNWGEGNVDKAIKANPENWLAGAPKATRDYVAANLSALEKRRGSIGSRKMSPAAVSASFMSIQDPVERKHAIASYESLSRLNSAMEQEASDAAIRTAMEMLPGVGFQFSRLPLSVQNAVDPKNRPALQNWSANMVKGDDITNPKLYQYYTTRPEELKNLTDDQFYNLRLELSDADWRHFAAMRGQIISGKGAGKGSGTPTDLDTSAVTREFNQSISMMGMDPTPKSDTDEASLMGARRRALDNYLLAAQRDAGKKFSDAEIKAHVGAFFLQSGQKAGWFSNSRAQLMRMTASDIGWGLKSQIKESLEASGIYNPTDAQIMEAYILSQTVRRKNTGKK